MQDKGEERAKGYTVLSGNDIELENFLKRFSQKMARNGGISEVRILTNVDLPQWVTKTVSRRIFRPSKKSRFDFLKSSNDRIKEMLSHYKRMDMFEDAAVKIRPVDRESLGLDVVLRAKDRAEMRVDLTSHHGEFVVGTTTKMRNMLDMCEVVRLNLMASPIFGLLSSDMSLTKPLENSERFMQVFVNSNDFKQEASLNKSELNFGAALESIDGSKRVEVLREHKSFTKVATIDEQLGLFKQGISNEMYKGLKLRMTKKKDNVSQDKYSLARKGSRASMDCGLSLDIGETGDKHYLEYGFDYTRFLKAPSKLTQYRPFRNSELEFNLNFQGIQPLFATGDSELNKLSNRYYQNQCAAFVNHEPDAPFDNYRVASSARINLFDSGLINYSDDSYLFGYGDVEFGFNYKNQQNMELNPRTHLGVGGVYKVSQMLNLELKLQIIRNGRLEPNALLNFNSGV